MNESKIQVLKSSLAVLYPIFIVCVTWTFLQGWIPHWGATWLFVVAGAVASIGIVPTFFNSRYLLLWLAYALILGANSLAGDSFWGRSFIPPVLELGMLLWAPAMTYYVFHSLDKVCEKRIIIWSLFIIVVTAIASLIIDTFAPGAIRTAARMRYEFQDNTMSLALYRFSCSNYSLPHALPILIPALGYVLRMNGFMKTKIWALVMILLCLLLIWTSGAMTAVLLGLMALVASLLISKKSPRRSLTIIVVFLLIISPFALNNELMLNLTSQMQTWVGEESPFYEKLVDAESYLITGEVSGDMETRNNLYSESLSLDAEELMLGTNRDVGGHSAIIDHFATLGILGFIVFLVILGAAVKKTYIMLPKDTLPFYVLGIITAFIMLLMKQMANIEVWLTVFTLMPLLLHYSYQINKQS